MVSIRRFREFAVSRVGVSIRDAVTVVILVALAVGASFARSHAPIMIVMLAALVTALAWAKRNADKQSRRKRDPWSAFIPIRTRRLYIRQPVRADAAALMAGIDDVVIEANGWLPEALTSYRQAVEQIDRLQPVGLLVLVERATGAMVGFLNVWPLQAGERSCELGWSVAAPARGKGFGTEAVAAVVRALHSAGIERVLVRTAVDNDAVHRVMAKTGARYTETGAHTLPNGVEVLGDSFVYDRNPPAS